MDTEKLVVFDIETVPDTRYVAGPAFPPLVFHQIIAIAFLEADVSQAGTIETYSLKELRAGGTLDYDEPSLIQGFLQFLDRLNRPRLVTYNGRGFDIPVIKYRCMIHNISAQALFKSDYSYRYNFELHCDLLELLSDFGASTRMKLSDICSALRVPAKIGMDGSTVAATYAAGEIESIRNYCELDVASTYLVYLRAMAMRGTVSPNDLEHATSEFRNYLVENSKSRPHFVSFLSEWDHLLRTDRPRDL